MSGHLYKRGRVWWCWFTDRFGNRQRESTGCTDRRAAEGHLKSRERAARGTPDAAPTPPGHSLTVAISYFLDGGMTDLAEATKKMYRQKAGHLVRLLGPTQINLLHRDDTAAFIKTRIKELVSTGSAEQSARSTVNKELITFRRVLKHAEARDEFAGNIAKVIPPFKFVYVPRTSRLSDEQFTRLIRELAPHRRLWVLLACYLGGRDSEIDGLRWEHIDWVRGVVRLPGKKTQKARRIVPLPAALVIHLKNIKQTAGLIVGDWANVRRDLPEACLKAKCPACKGDRVASQTCETCGNTGRLPVPRCTPNDLRRTFGSWLKNSGVDSAVVARLLGHSSTRMVDLVYGHLDDPTLAAATALLPRCDTFVTDKSVSVGRMGRMGKGRKRGSRREIGILLVPRDGVEPPTRGFSIRCSTS